jgi:hypothetical protein
MSAIADAMRATIASTIVNTVVQAHSLIRYATEADPAINVKLARLWSRNTVLPPNPRSLIIDSAKSSPQTSAFNTTFLLNLPRQRQRNDPSVVGIEDTDIHERQPP